MQSTFYDSVGKSTMYYLKPEQKVFFYST